MQVENKIKIDVLISGTHKTVEDSEDFTVIDPHTSSVTLLRTNNNNILVDAGGRGFYKKICARLKEFGLKPDDIDILILTHFHLDHVYNLAIFGKARVLGWRHFWDKRKTTKIKKINMYEINMYEVVPGISIFQTPGHAEEHLVVLVQESDDSNTVIAGDAINKTYHDEGRIAAFRYDEGLYRESADKIIEIADLIIPGHGKPFKARKNNLQA